MDRYCGLQKLVTLIAKCPLLLEQINIADVTTGGQMRKLECLQYTQVGNAIPPLFSIALKKLY